LVVPENGCGATQQQLMPSDTVQRSTAQTDEEVAWKQADGGNSLNNKNPNGLKKPPLSTLLAERECVSAVTAEKTMEL